MSLQPNHMLARTFEGFLADLLLDPATANHPALRAFLGASPAFSGAESQERSSGATAPVAAAAPKNSAAVADRSTDR